MGEDPERAGVKDTPKRMANALLALTAGYSVAVEDEVRDAMFDVDGQDLVVVKDIDVFSLCEHHILPFFGKVRTPVRLVFSLWVERCTPRAAARACDTIVV